MPTIDPAEFLDQVRLSTVAVVGMARIAIDVIPGARYQVSPAGRLEICRSDLTAGDPTPAEKTDLYAALRAGQVEVIITPLIVSGARPRRQVLLRATGEPAAYVHDSPSVMKAFYALRQ